MMCVVPKAFVYLTRKGRELLLLAHPQHPEAGLQVPAGTIRAGETPVRAAARELFEETGIDDVRFDGLLGECVVDMRPFGKQEFHRRYFHHAVLTGAAAERWRHVEMDGGPAPIPFELFWWPLCDGDPDLAADHGAMIHRLRLELRHTPVPR